MAVARKNYFADCINDFKIEQAKSPEWKWEFDFENGKVAFYAGEESMFSSLDRFKSMIATDSCVILFCTTQEYTSLSLEDFANQEEFQQFTSYCQKLFVEQKSHSVFM